MALAPWISHWDRLAISLARPYCSPGWLIPWWEHMRPQRSSLAVVLLVEGPKLLGVAPFFLQPERLGGQKLRLLGSGMSHGMDILATPPAETAAAHIVGALAEMHPTLLSFESIDAKSTWPEQMRSGWPGRRRARLVTTGRRPAPGITFDDEHGDWLQRRERKFRREIARARRRLAELHGRTELAVTDDEREAALTAFERLHAARWARRGGTSLSMRETGKMLRDVTAWMPPDRLRMWCTYLGHEIIAIDICVASGDTMSFWNGGWDERYRRLGPGILTTVAAIEDSERRGERRVELGGGQAAYKLRLADTSATAVVTTQVVVPRGKMYARARLALLPHVLKRDARRVASHLPPTWRRVQSVLRTR